MQPDTPTGHRAYLGLIGHLGWPLVEAIFQNNPYRIAGDRPLAEAWAASAACAGDRAAPGPEDKGPAPLIRPLGPAIERAIAADRETIARSMDEIGDFQFGMVSLTDLLTPQFDVDLDHVQALECRLGRKADPDALARFCFERSRLGDPMLMGSQAVFTSLGRDLRTDAAPRARRIDAHAMEFYLTVSTRLNYLQIARVDGRHLIVANGVHRVLALLRGGYEEAPCLWRSIESLDELGLTAPGSALIADSLYNHGVRPARMVDFCDPSLAVRLEFPSTFLHLRLDLTSSLSLAPLPIG